MKLSSFGKKLTSGSGIVDLMEDLGAALNENPEMIFMGGGNPARIPEMEVVFKTQYKRLSESSEQLYITTGVYQSPQGELGFRRDIAAMLKDQFGWSLTEANIAISNGSQSAFYILFNLSFTSWNLSLIACLVLSSIARFSRAVSKLNSPRSNLR